MQVWIRATAASWVFLQLENTLMQCFLAFFTFCAICWASQPSFLTVITSGNQSIYLYPSTKVSDSPLLTCDQHWQAAVPLFWCGSAIRQSEKSLLAFSNTVWQAFSVAAIVELSVSVGIVQAELISVLQLFSCQENLNKDGNVLKDFSYSKTTF